jgi:hypothetical protein
MPRIDIRHLSAKNKLKLVVDAAGAYADTMRSQGKSFDRIVVSKADYEALHRRAQSHHPNRTVFLCLGDVLVHWSREPIDEAEIALVSRYPQAPQYDLPPVDANPFGVAPPPRQAEVSSDDFDDNDVPF